MKTNPKRIIAVILSVMLLLCSLPIVSFAAEYEGECGENMRWSFSDGVLEITGSGAMTEYESYTDSPWYEYRESVTKVVVADGVTSVSAYAFASCRNLKEAVLPPSLTELSMGMFSDCGFESFDIPDTVERIGRGTFNYCTLLESINIPYGVKEIDSFAFNYCDLKTVTIPGSVKKLGYASADLEVVVGECIFAYNENLETVIIENGVEEIGGAALFDAHALKNVVIPDSVKTLGVAAFGSCISLESLVIPASVTRIDTGALYNCGNLTDIYYKGSQEQWNEIEISEEFHSFDGITVHYDYVAIEDVIPEDGQIIRTPSTDTIKYGDTLILHSGIEALPEGMKIVWMAEGEGVTLTPSENTLTCKVSSVENGSVTITATLTDTEGKPVTDAAGNEIKTEQTVNSKVNFIYKMISFIKNIFGFSRTILQAV